EVAEETPVPGDVAEILIARILTKLEALAADVERISREVPRILRMNVGDPGRFADLVATLANFSVAQKDAVLQRLSIEDRLGYVLEGLERELKRLRQVEDAEEAAESAARAETGEEPEARAPGAEAPAGGRNRLEEIRQQIKRLRAELGEVDPAEVEAVELLRRIDAADLPPGVAAAARSAVERLRISGSAAESGEIRSYLD